MINEEPILILQKNADKTSNKIVLPKNYIEKYGRMFYMKIYPSGKIVLEPITSLKGE